MRDEEVIAAADGRRRHAVLHRHPALLPLSRTADGTSPVTDSATVTARSSTARPPRPTIKAELAERVATLARAGRRARARHRAGRRRPGQPLVRRRQAPGLRRGRHRPRSARPAGDRDPGRGRGGRRRAERRPGLHRLHRPAAAARRARRRRVARAGSTRPRTPTGCTRPTSAGWCSARPAPLPCTPRGIVELLRRYDVPIAGAEVVVVGRGVTVGRPLGLLLTRRTENATVTLCHTGTRDLAAHVRRADIVVAAAGVPGLVTADMVKPGAAVARRRHHPHRRRAGRRRRTRTCARSPAASRRSPAGSAR